MAEHRKYEAFTHRTHRGIESKSKRLKWVLQPEIDD